MNFRELLDAVKLMDEASVLAMLDAERSGPKRMSFLIRLHQRYSALRAARERKEIIKSAVA